VVNGSEESRPANAERKDDDPAKDRPGGGVFATCFGAGEREPAIAGLVSLVQG